MNNSLRAKSESECCCCDTLLTLYPQNPKQFMVWTKLWSKFYHIYLSFANFATKLADLKFNLVTQMSMKTTKINFAKISRAEKVSQTTFRLKLFIWCINHKSLQVSAIIFYCWFYAFKINRNFTSLYFWSFYE